MWIWTWFCAVFRFLSSFCVLYNWAIFGIKLVSLSNSLLLTVFFNTWNIKNYFPVPESERIQYPEGRARRRTNDFIASFPHRCPWYLSWWTIFVHGPHQQDGDATSGRLAGDARPASDTGRRPTDGSSGAGGSHAATRRNDGLSNATVSGTVVT